MNLTETYIKDQFIAGLANSVLQTEILAKSNQLTTLDAVIAHAEAYETALRDQNILSGEREPESTNIYALNGRREFDEHQQRKNRNGNRRSQNNRHSNQNNNDHRDDIRHDNKTSDHDHHPSSRQQKPCSGCGSTEHGAPGSNNRSTLCPAWGKDCASCGKANHFASVCKS